MGEAKVVNIILGDDQNTRALKVEEIIHPREFELVINLIQKSFSKAEEKPAESEKDSKNIYRTRYHDTIVVSGSRGTGKTTFLMTLLKGIENGEIKQKEGGHSDNLSKIKVLPILDPTLIELKAHPFVSIISLIYDAVTESIDCCRVHCDEKLDKKLEEWKDCFNSLAEGLPVLDGIGNGALTGSEWDDPQYVMQEGIRKARAANNLEENFNRFVEESLKLLNKGAFLICFDDIDTDFTKGWPILEILRKYLTSPKIITILSGDLELYSAIVRKSQWDNVGIDRVKGETDDQLQKFKDLVSQLENQYLLKLLRPERRINLNSVFANISQFEINYKINNMDIIEYYKKRLLQRNSFKLEEEIDIVIEFVENLPIRTQMQLLLALNGNDSEIEKSVFNVFWNNWNEWNSDNSVVFDQPDRFPIVVVRFLIRKNLIEDGHYLIPNNPNFSKSAALFISGLYYQSLTKTRPAFIFEYLLRIGLAHEMQRFVFAEIEEPEDKSFELLIEHCKILTETNLRVISGRLNSFLFANNANKKGEYFDSLGAIDLFSLHTIAKNNEVPRIDFELKNSKNALVLFLGFIPLSLVSDNRGYRAPRYSIYNLISFIGELLKWSKSKNTVTIDELSNYLKLNSVVKAYPIPKSRFERQVKKTVADSFTTPEGDINTAEFEDFIKELSIWLNNIPEAPSTYFLANMSSRFFQNLLAVKDTQFETLAEWMNIQVVTFLNTVLIEESLQPEAQKISGSIRLTNILTSVSHFSSNLATALPYSQLFPVTFWLVGCPLLAVFIDISLKGFSKLNPNEESLTTLINSPKSILETLAKIDLKSESVSVQRGGNKSNSESLDEYLLKDSTVQNLTEYCRKNKISDFDIDRMNNLYFKKRILRLALELKGNPKITVYDELRIRVKAGLQQ